MPHVLLHKQKAQCSKNFSKTSSSVVNDTLSNLIEEPTHIVASNIDELVLKGIKHIQEKGEFIEPNPKPCQQAYDVHYTLSEPLNRVHTIRNPTAQKYLCRELLAYFKGSLNVNDGLAQASNVWKMIADENNEIVSNYGYYVFRQKLPQVPNMSQYDWAIYHLVKNLDTRKAVINISQTYHKKIGIKDYPCTMGIQFFVKKNHLCCAVSSRSTDVYTGLPYDMGFFAFLTELVYKDVKSKLSPEAASSLKLGYVTMKTDFIQIYHKTRTPVLNLFEKCKDLKEKYYTDMPEIDSPKDVLNDINNGTIAAPVIKWIHKNAEF